MKQEKKITVKKYDFIGITEDIFREHSNKKIIGYKKGFISWITPIDPANNNHLYLLTVTKAKFNNLPIKINEKQEQPELMDIETDLANNEVLAELHYGLFDFKNDKLFAFSAIGVQAISKIKTAISPIKIVTSFKVQEEVITEIPINLLDDLAIYNRLDIGIDLQGAPEGVITELTETQEFYNIFKSFIDLDMKKFEITIKKTSPRGLDEKIINTLIKTLLKNNICTKLKIKGLTSDQVSKEIDLIHPYLKYKFNHKYNSFINQDEAATLLLHTYAGIYD